MAVAISINSTWDIVAICGACAIMFCICINHMYAQRNQEEGLPSYTPNPPLDATLPKYSEYPEMLTN